MNAKSALTVAMVAGFAGTVAASNTPTTLSADNAQVNKAGHIYYNVATGERVVTMFNNGQTSAADTGNSVPIWQALVQNACEAQGYTTSYFFGVDNPGATSLSTAVTNVDWGDIATDTVVDCIQVNWVVAHPDEWANGSNSDDGVVGIEELAGQWMVFDADNGNAVDRSTRLPLIDFTFFNLPGNTPDNFDAGALTGWTADVDLTVAGDFGTDLTFEIGDSDGDCQGASFCNNDVDTDFDDIGDGVSVAAADRNFDGLPDSDLDGDGLFDFSWSVRFYQPGIGNDFDSDSDTGSAFPTASDTIGISFGYPEGSAVDNGDGTWTWEVDEMADAAGTGAEDGFAIYGPAVSNTDAGTYAGGFFFGGFACTGGLISTGGTGYTPPAMFQFVLYGPDTGTGGGCNDADLNEDDMLDFFDVSLFIQAFNNMDSVADFNDDGLYDFFDVSLYIQEFNMGCP